jgi:DNA-binding NarL/FixJ family response regulator
MLQMLLKLVFQDSSTKKLETLGISIIKVHQGKIIMNETVKKNLALIAKQSKSERLYRLSNREVEVLRYLSDGKNHEIADILKLNEKISTYKLRLLTKLNVTNGRFSK